jgi:type IV secretory pathway ATPase VirB11/archaellum biosynthesis ATPase
MTRPATDGPTIPAPTPPDSPDAWYAPDVRAQREVHPGVVVTVRGTRDGFTYDVREPTLAPPTERALDRVRDHFADAHLSTPRTREGTRERMEAGFEPKYATVVDRLVDCSAAARRRLDYHACRDLRCLGDLTPLALDDDIEVADRTDDDRLVVHTTDYAPVTTDLSADADGLDRFASERIDAYTVPFRDFEVPVVLYRERLLGGDAFTTKYAVREPDLLPGDETLVDACKERIWEANVGDLVEDSGRFVTEQAHRFLSRQLTARNTRAWLDATTHRVRAALSEYGVGVPPVDGRYSRDRLSDLVYYVCRDYVGEGQLTVPIRDPHLEDVEANRVGERVKVVPRADRGTDGRVPTNLRFDDEGTFVDVVTQLAAADGVELNASNPSAKVNLDPEGVADDVTIRCAVALPVISEDGPHISIRKQSPDAMTPVDLVQRDSLPTELVALLWLCYEHHCVVLFSGPTGVGKTTLMNAHMPFVPFDDRPISIDEGSREVRLPHETGVSLTTRDHESAYKRVTMADLMTETNYLNPDVEVIAEINTPESFATFSEVLNTGHGVLGTTHAADVETLVNRVIEQGLPSYLLRELDLVVFPRHVGGDRYVGEVVEFVAPEAPVTERADAGTVRKGDVEVGYNTVCERAADGYDVAYDHPDLGDDRHDVGLALFAQLAERTDRSVAAVEDEFHRKHRYVEYLVRESVTDFDDLFGFLADLRADEAATVERVHRRTTEDRGGPRLSTDATVGTAPEDAPDDARGAATDEATGEATGDADD